MTLKTVFERESGSSNTFPKTARLWYNRKFLTYTSLWRIIQIFRATLSSLFITNSLLFGVKKFKYRKISSNLGHVLITLDTLCTFLSYC